MCLTSIIFSSTNHSSTQLILTLLLNIWYPYGKASKRIIISMGHTIRKLFLCCLSIIDNVNISDKKSTLIIGKISQFFVSASHYRLELGCLCSTRFGTAPTDGQEWQEKARSSLLAAGDYVLCLLSMTQNPQNLRTAETAESRQEFSSLFGYPA